MNNFPAICFWPDWPEKFGLLKSGQEDLAGLAENWPDLIAMIINDKNNRT
jgi:hypothetical protein